QITYSAGNSFHRWSDAKGSCTNGGGILAKIRNIQDIQRVRQHFLLHQDPKYWVGIKFDTTKSNFVWADGSVIPSNDADFESIVNRQEQLLPNYRKRCMYATEQNKLVADDCEAHYKYICQKGGSLTLFTAPSSPMKQLSPSLHSSSPSSLVSSSPSLSSSLSLSSSSSLESAAAESPQFSTQMLSYNTAVMTSTQPISSMTSAKKKLSAASSLILTSSSTSLHIIITPSLTSANGVQFSSVEYLVTKHESEINQLDVGDSLSLQRAANLTSSLLNNVNKIPIRNLSINILVSGAKLEKFAVQYAQYHWGLRNSSKAEMSIEMDEVALAAMKIPAGNKEDVIFPSNSAASGKNFIQEEKNAVTLPASLFSYQERYVVCMLYKNIAELIPEQDNRLILICILIYRQDMSIVSRVVSCSLFPEVPGVLTDKVTIKLKSIKRGTTGVTPSCGFWNFSIRTKIDGAWSKTGCTLVESTRDQTICSCNHLTNFAVLMEVGETKISDDNKFALEVVTYIGTSLSLFGETITIMVYLILMNLKTAQSHIRLNMVSCLAAGQLVFIIGISATRHKVLCTAVALTINYFYLVAFGWMVAEGVMLYLKVVKVFNVMTTTKYFYGFAWGFPTILVVSAVVTNVLIKGSMDSSMRDDVCWFSFSSGFVWVFIGPVLMACLVNLVILLRIVVEMMRLTDMSGISETNSTRQSLKACAVLSPLLGFTWMFGVLTVTDTAGLVFQYFFTILNSLQGFFIFIFHVIRSKEIKAALEIRRQRWETTRSISVATEKSTIGRGRVSTAREKGNSLRGIDLNKISPDETSNINRDMPTVM
ncbi:unnamed protein product, partial [Porites lobata]